MARLWNALVFERNAIAANARDAKMPVGAQNDELPYVQKLCNRVRDSADLAVLTLNMDENTGLIEPFLKEDGYTFPALPALEYERAPSDSDSACSVPGSSARKDC